MKAMTAHEVEFPLNFGSKPAKYDVMDAEKTGDGRRKQRTTNYAGSRRLELHPRLERCDFTSERVEWNFTVPLECDIEDRETILRLCLLEKWTHRYFKTLYAITEDYYREYLVVGILTCIASSWSDTYRAVTISSIQMVEAAVKAFSRLYYAMDVAGITVAPVATVDRIIEDWDSTHAIDVPTCFSACVMK
ncbi:uncharacterized protein ARMOST_06592 [Armillaria ostoyae]|uniref:Uncharacterized protein n=1 Tax=Armillaria ostoyae TaxID=47428 RepID=A0A284R3E7_ARMOS|nr:uncharacterized protein ARMOST_06592 [Armillaria ostoyae]